MAPADAVADVLAARGHTPVLMTDARGAAIGNMLQGVKRHLLPSKSHMRGGLVGKAQAAFSVLKATGAARGILKDERPQAVIGFGGYPAFPAVKAAQSLAVPYLLHEQNAVLGRVNRWTASSAKRLLLSLENTRRIPMGVEFHVTGNPARAGVAQARKPFESVCGDGPIRLLVMGGSQGARILSDVVPAAVSGLDSALKSRVQVVQQARSEDVDRVNATYSAAGVEHVVAPYFDDIPAHMADAHLVIARSGASTIAELVALARPALFVPLKIAADDHQTANAATLVEAGSAWAMAEGAFTTASVTEFLTRHLGDMSALRTASERLSAEGDAAPADQIVDHIESVAKSAGGRS